MCACSCHRAASTRARRLTHACALGVCPAAQWDCLRGCTRGGIELPDLNSISVNVRLGGFGYDRAYYNAQGGLPVIAPFKTTNCCLSLAHGQKLPGLPQAWFCAASP